MFHRGIGVKRIKDMFMAQKIDLLVNYLIAWPSKQVGPSGNVCCSIQPSAYWHRRVAHAQALPAFKQVVGSKQVQR